MFAIKGEDHETYYRHINAAIEHRPNVTMDDGGDVVARAPHATRKRLARRNVIGGTEETTTGVIRLRAMAKEGMLGYPIVAVNDAMTKHMFDNRYGTGQSTIDGMIRATNRLMAGKRLRGRRLRLVRPRPGAAGQGLGADVVVTEIDPNKAMEAVMDGFRVMPMEEAAKIGDFFITVTGNMNVIRARALRVDEGRRHRRQQRPLQRGARPRDPGEDREGPEHRPRIRRAVHAEERQPVMVLGEGRLVNLAAAEGHPPSVMDMSFANQALCSEWMVKNHRTLEKRVYTVPEEIDKEIARLKLKAMGVKIDILTDEQDTYLNSWNQGT